MGLSKLTEGAFGVTVQPLWNLYAHHAQSGSLPSETEIEKVRRRIGWEHIRIEPEIIYFDRPACRSHSTEWPRVWLRISRGA